jgi:methylated-DNA-[protein]-cysteine S-methyltransferase
MAEIFTAHLKTPIGWLEVLAEADAILSVNFLEEPGEGRRPATEPKAFPAVLKACLGQLEDYFRGERTSFDLPLRLAGTPFRERVWAALLCVPYGRTTTYGELAAALGNARAGRAVGGANHHNPVSIIVPCHRVVGSDGRLVGYGGGLWRKEWLLGHERANVRRGGQSPDGGLR